MIYVGTLSSETWLTLRNGRVPFQVHFYEVAGFEVVGPSTVVHGQDTWIECAMEL